MMKIWQVNHGPNQGRWAWKIEAPAVTLPVPQGRMLRQAKRNGLTSTRASALSHARRAAVLHERLGGDPRLGGGALTPSGATHDNAHA